MDPNPYESPSVPDDRQDSVPSAFDPGTLRVCCECGQWLPVKAREAGGKVTCPCGRPIVVPLLEEFRSSPNLLSAATIERRIRRLIAKRELPITGSCAKCGFATAVEAVPMNVECERYTARAYGGEGFLYIPFLPLLWWREEERVEIHGRDTDVAAPVCLCVPCQESFHGWPRSSYLGFAACVFTLGVVVGFFSLAAGIAVEVAGLIGFVFWKRVAYRNRQRALKHLLYKVPVYGQLLSSYPDAVVVMPGPRKNTAKQKAQ